MQLLVDNGIDIQSLDKGKLKSFLKKEDQDHDKKFIADLVKQKNDALFGMKLREYYERKVGIEPKSVMQLLVDNGIDIQSLDKEQLKSFLKEITERKIKSF